MHLTAVLGRHVGRVDDVLDADRQAIERAHPSPLPALIVGSPRLRQRSFVVEERPGAQLWLTRLDAGKAGLDQLL